MSAWKAYLAVGLGSGLGSVLRYGVSLLSQAALGAIFLGNAHRQRAGLLFDWLAGGHYLALSSRSIGAVTTITGRWLLRRFYHLFTV
ncbi:hypothetical protein HORIV_52100 [Vreelandella olivaria]|uniref:Fluoride ion transporter CrcB n=1 Tax=Vreelandella olivaria TaxID=390919 RepID=A0ABM7GP36_9GAMM|nr:hypothetical protein HORIV_52100 [Halomonas olivaria]